MHPLNEPADAHVTIRLPSRVIKLLDKEARRERISRSQRLYLILCDRYGYPGSQRVNAS